MNPFNGGVVDNVSVIVAVSSEDLSRRLGAAAVARRLRFWAFGIHDGKEDNLTLNLTNQLSFFN
jgi:hypothetical protein